MKPLLSEGTRPQFLLLVLLDFLDRLIPLLLLAKVAFVFPGPMNRDVELLQDIQEGALLQ